MATNKHAIIRYQALDKCFRATHKRFYIKDLIKACNDALYDYTGDTRFVYETWMNDNDHNGIKRRQIYNDIEFMRSSAGYSAPIIVKKDGREAYYSYDDYDYSICKQPLTEEEATKLREVIFTLNRFKGTPQFEWIEDIIPKLEDRFNLSGISESVIGFEQNIYIEGLQHLSPLFNAIVNKQPQHILYQKFDGTEFAWNIHPYYIKQYNGRWFLFGYNDGFGTISNIPLDRINKRYPINIPFHNNECIDFNNDYFSDIVGVNIPSNGIIEKILLKFSEHRINYVKTKPLHESQRIHQDGTVELRVIPNKELIALIMSFADDVEVLEPQHIRKTISEKVAILAKKYSFVHNDCTDTL